MSAAAMRSPSVVVIDSEPSAVATIKSLLSANGIQAVREADNPASGLRLVREYHPDLVFIELPATDLSVLEAVQRIRTEFPQTGIIVSSAEGTPHLILRSMRAGAQEFLSRPLTSRELLEAVERLTALFHLTGRSQKPGGRVLAVFSTKGGVGVSSIATNLAVVISRQANFKVALVDLDFQSADLELMLALKSTATISDAVSAGPIQEPRLRSSLATHDSGICLLSAPHRLEDAEKITGAHLVDIFGVLRAMFDHVVVDAGHTLDDRMLEVLELSDLIVVPVLLNVPTVRGASRALELFQKLGFPVDKTLVVVNRDQAKTKIRVTDVEQTLGRGVFSRLPNDYSNMMRSIDVGVPVVIEANRSRVTRSLEELGKRIVELSAPETLDPGETGSHPRRRSLAVSR